MKYTIEGLQQGVLLDLSYQEYDKKKEKIIIKHPIDIADAVILRFVIDFYFTGRMTEIQINGKTYFWLNYKTVIKELPLLKIKEMHGIANRFRKYEKVGLLKKKIVHEKDGIKGTYTFFRFTEKLGYLLFTPETKSSDPCNEKFTTPETQSSPPPETKSSDKDSSTIINPSINNNSDSIESPVKDIAISENNENWKYIESLFREKQEYDNWGKQRKHCKGLDKRIQKTYDARAPDMPLNEFTKWLIDFFWYLIQSKKPFWEKQKNCFFPATLNSERIWNMFYAEILNKRQPTYEDYLGGLPDDD